MMTTIPRLSKPPGDVSLGDHGEVDNVFRRSQDAGLVLVDYGTVVYPDDLVRSTIAASRLHVMTQEVPQVTGHLPFFGLIKVWLPPVTFAEILELSDALRHHIFGMIGTVLDLVEDEKQVETYPHRFRELVDEFLAEVVAVHAVVFVYAAMEFPKE